VAGQWFAWAARRPVPEAGPAYGSLPDLGFGRTPLFRKSAAAATIGARLLRVSCCPRTAAGLIRPAPPDAELSRLRAASHGPAGTSGK